MLAPWGPSACLAVAVMRACVANQLHGAPPTHPPIHPPAWLPGCLAAAGPEADADATLEQEARLTNPRWLAPEVIRSQTSSQKGDVFSFAVIMYAPGLGCTGRGGGRGAGRHRRLQPLWPQAR